MQINRTQTNKSIIKGKDANNRIDNIRFTDLEINGVPVTSANSSQYFDIDSTTASVVFDP